MPIYSHRLLAPRPLLQDFQLCTCKSLLDQVRVAVLQYASDRAEGATALLCLDTILRGALIKNALLLGVT